MHSVERDLCGNLRGEQGGAEVWPEHTRQVPAAAATRGRLAPVPEASGSSSGSVSVLSLPSSLRFHG